MYKNNYRFSILIPGWNAESYVENCITSILENDYKSYQIITIVGGRDNSYSIALKLQKEYPDKIIALEQKIPHKNKACNLGLEKVNGDIIVITDIDCIYQKDWLSRVNEIFQDKKYNVITGLYFPFPNIKNSLTEFVNIKQASNLINFKHASVVKGNKLCGANSMFRKELFFTKIGKFDENVRTGDDKFLGIEFNKKGESLYFFQDIYVYTEFYSNDLIKFVKHRIRWSKDIFIFPLTKKEKLRLIVSFIIAIFKLFYPIFSIIIALLFFNAFYIWLFILPWLIFYFSYLIKFYFDLKSKSIKVNSQLKKNFNYKKAFNIVPLMFFIFGLINIIGLIYPKKIKWHK